MAINDPNHESELVRLWAEYQAGKITAIEFGQRSLQTVVSSHGSVTPDLDRMRRCGFPEVIYGAGKTTDAIVAAANALLETTDEVLITRASPEQVRYLAEQYEYTRWNSVAKTFRIRNTGQPLPPEEIADAPNRRRTENQVAVVSAGTTDEPVAREALETLAWMGIPTVLIQDIGVAGPYRLLSQVPVLQRMSVIVCVAGMEGALPSVLAGHVRCPVIAVPTSVGYGANFAGLSSLLSMLNSCAANVAVVNIDAGFKGGYLAGLISLD